MFWQCSKCLRWPTSASAQVRPVLSVQVIIIIIIIIIIGITYYIFCCRNRNWDSPHLMQFWFFFFFLIIQSQAAFVNCLYVARFTNTNKVSIIIIIIAIYIWMPSENLCGGKSALFSMNSNNELFTHVLRPEIRSS